MIIFVKEILKMFKKILTMTIPKKNILTETNYQNYQRYSKEDVSILIKTTIDFDTEYEKEVLETYEEN